MTNGPKGADSPAADAVIDDVGPAAFRPGSDTAAPAALQWDVLDRFVQDSLSTLTARILAQEPGTVWKAGRTATRAFPLFSYQVFYHLDGDDYDPVVVGLTFTVRDSNVRVAGDISGDESGFVYYDEECTIDVPIDQLAVRDAARVVMDRLTSQESVVLDAIRHRHLRATAQ
jgi:hypothetical protein